MHDNNSSPAHFKDKDAIGHVAEAQAQGILAAAEIHGTEIPGHLSAGSDAAREISLYLLAFWILLLPLTIPYDLTIQLLVVLACGLIVWKTGRSAWLAWSQLERLHRIVAQERWEIEHHRQQERDELHVLYAAKGFEGKLLEEVLDVLMADDNRLLGVMVQEEMGLSLETHEHPIKQALGAFVGSFLAAIFCIGFLMLLSGMGLILATAFTVAISSAISAYYVGNRIIPAIVWNLGIGLLAASTVYFLLSYLFSFGFNP